MTKPKTYPVCSGCGSTHVLQDAWAEWDHEAQRWVLSNTFDDAYCEEEDGDCSIEWKEGDPPEEEDDDEQ